LMLDCVNIREKSVLGFDWQSALDEAVKCFRKDYQDSTLLIKPHPRQDVSDVKHYLNASEIPENVSLVEESEGEPFIALSDEIWGMTTVLLVVALKAGKPIKVFMPGRTEAGARESNDH